MTPFFKLNSNVINQIVIISIKVLVVDIVFLGLIYKIYDTITIFYFIIINGWNMW